MDTTAGTEQSGESPILAAARRLEPLKGGFDAVDWPVAKFILKTPAPTSRQINCLWRILKKYEPQLRERGIDFATLTPPELTSLAAAPVEKRPEVKLYFVKVGRYRRLAAAFNQDTPIREVANTLMEGFNSNTPQSFFDDKSRLWVYPADVESVRSVISAFESISPPVDVTSSKIIKEFIEESEKAYEQSRAETADIEIPTKLPLYPFQRAGVKWIVDHDGRALVADEMGLGKTPEGLGFLALCPEALPALVVCPANVRVNWVKEAAKFTNYKCLIIAAKTLIKPLSKLKLEVDGKNVDFEVSDRPKPGFDITIINYNLLTCDTLKSWLGELIKGDVETQAAAVKEIILCGQRAMPVLQKELTKHKDMETLNRISRAIGGIEKLGEKARSPKAPPHTKAFANGIVVDEFIEMGQFRTMIDDESHYLMESRSQRSLCARKISTRVKNVIGLTGTPVLNKPMELWSQLNIINNRIFPDFLTYGKEFCGATNNGFGWRFTGASNLEKLEKILRSTVMIRRMKTQVLKELPPKTRITFPVAIESKMAQYEKEAKEPLAELARLHKEREDWKALMASMSPSERKKYLAEHAEQAMEAGKLTNELFNGIEKLKQLAVNIKFKECLDFVIDSHQQEGKVLVFVTHHQTTDRLMKALTEEKIKVNYIDGRVNGADREIVKESFQSGDLEILICGIRAASEGLTLTASHTVIMFEFDWNPGKMHQAEDRTHRITQTMPVMIYYLVAFGTIEEKIVKMIDSKREVANAVLGESDRTLSEDGILDALVSDILGKPVGKN